jgi:hypothetical protein
MSSRRQGLARPGSEAGCEGVAESADNPATPSPTRRAFCSPSNNARAHLDTCRFASDPTHVCRRNDGQLLGAGQVCFYEAAAQLREQRRTEAVNRRLASLSFPVSCPVCNGTGELEMPV